MHYKDDSHWRNTHECGGEIEADTWAEALDLAMTREGHDRSTDYTYVRVWLADD